MTENNAAARPCFGLVLFVGHEISCGSTTKHPSGLCYMHRQDETRRLRQAYREAKASGGGPGVPRSELTPMTEPTTALRDWPCINADHLGLCSADHVHADHVRTSGDSRQNVVSDPSQPSTA